MARVTITLSEEARDALVVLAQREERDPRRQAALIIRRQLEDCGLLEEPVRLEPRHHSTMVPEAA